MTLTGPPAARGQKPPFEPRSKFPVSRPSQKHDLWHHCNVFRAAAPNALMLADPAAFPKAV
jgi:hypothetical protein